jgi:hypothetical protein
MFYAYLVELLFILRTLQGESLYLLRVKEGARIPCNIHSNYESNPGSPLRVLSGAPDPAAWARMRTITSLN